jgi:hypothetical protein
MDTTAAFEDWFDFDGWEEVQDPAPAPNTTIVALYLLNGSPTHAARYLGHGLWTSKLGHDIDLAHELHELDGPTYGTPARFFRKGLLAS